MFAHFWTFVFVVFAVCFHQLSTGEVVIRSWVDFDCPEANRTGQLVYTKSIQTDTNSTQHYIWSTIGGHPAFFIVHTKSSKNVTIDWKKVLENKRNSVSFGSESIHNTIGFLFSKMYFWEDTSDNFENVNNTLVHPINFKDINWDPVEDHWSHNHKSCIAQFTFKKNHTINNGTIAIKLKVVNSDQRYDSLPHLLINDKSMHIQTIVDNMQYNKEKLRLGFELLIFATGNSYSEKSATSIDDEYSPGIFKTYNLLFEDKQQSKTPSFLQWKPVIYSTPQLIISKMLQTTSHKLRKENEIPQDNYPLFGFVTGLKNGSFSMYRFNVTFGSKGEEFYSDSNYTNWCFAIGLGKPHEDEMSVSIKLIIVICFGLPAFALLMLPIVLIVIKCKQKKNLLLDESIQ